MTIEDLLSTAPVAPLEMTIEDSLSTVPIGFALDGTMRLRYGRLFFEIFQSALQKRYESRNAEVISPDRSKKFSFR